MKYINGYFKEWNTQQDTSQRENHRQILHGVRHIARCFTEWKHIKKLHGVRYIARYFTELNKQENTSQPETQRRMLPFPIDLMTVTFVSHISRSYNTDIALQHFVVRISLQHFTVRISLQERERESGRIDLCWYHQ